MNTTLNGICPYFTMFPLDFPLGVLSRHDAHGKSVLDPFAGRGTTLYAGRLLGMKSFGIDSNPVAAAISEAKLANTSPGRIVAAAKRILDEVETPQVIPEGEFWELAFQPTVLQTLCRFREGLLANSKSPTRKALRAIILGALHGPLTKSEPSYFSNQCTRTYAPKPRYAVKFWRKHGFKAPMVDALSLIERRAKRFYADCETRGDGAISLADSTTPEAFASLSEKVDWIITSPPYYGMRTYLPDQWLRLWFVGGPSTVTYSNDGQISHESREDFADGLRKVWRNCAKKAKKGTRLVIRFGSINDRKVDPVEVLKESLKDTPWTLVTSRNAGCPSEARRQASHFVDSASPIAEHDVWAQFAA